MGRGTLASHFRTAASRTFTVGQDFDLHVIQILEPDLNKNRPRNLVGFEHGGVLAEPEGSDPLDRVRYTPRLDLLARAGRVR